MVAHVPSMHMNSGFDSQQHYAHTCTHSHLHTHNCVFTHTCIFTHTRKNVYEYIKCEIVYFLIDWFWGSGTTAWNLFSWGVVLWHMIFSELFFMKCFLNCCKVLFMFCIPWTQLLSHLSVLFLTIINKNEKDTIKSTGRNKCRRNQSRQTEKRNE